jgi:hypothetical protein
MMAVKSKRSDPREIREKEKKYLILIFNALE